MTIKSVLTPYFEHIERSGGYGTCHINFKRGPLDQTLNREQISGLKFSVEIMFPFTFSGKELIAIGTGKHESPCSYLVADIADLEYNLQQGRLAAFRNALTSLASEARLEILRARPGTSPARQNRKITAMFKAMSTLGLVPITQATPPADIPMTADPWEQVE